MASRFFPLLASGTMRPLFAFVGVVSVASGCTFEPPAAGPPVDASDASSADAERSDPDAATLRKDATVADAGGDADGGFEQDAAMDGGLLGDAEPNNTLPVAVDDTATATVGMTVQIDVLANDSDPDGDSLTLVGAGTAQNGTTRITATQMIEYEPSPLYVGVDEFDYVVSDGRGGEAVGRVTVDVRAPPLSISPANIDINLNSRATFSGAGGSTPYTFQLTSGGGRIDGTTGEYFSPGTAGMALVSVVDAVGQTATATVTFGTGDLFYLGGVRDDASSDVYVSADGASWSTSGGGLPAPRYLLAAVVFEDAIYIVGGRDEQDDATDVVLRSTDGVSWDDSRTAPIQLRGCQLAVFQERLFLLGGRDTFGIIRSDVWSSTDGDNWIHEGNMPAPRAYGSAIVHDGALFYAGGTNLSVQEEVWFTTDGVNWTPRTDLPAPRRFAAISSFGGDIWIAGGNDASDDGVSTVWTSPDGTGWTPATQLPVGLGGASAVAWGDQLWIVAGGVNYFASGARDQARVLMSNGWNTTGQLPQERFWGALVIFKP